MNAHDLLWKTVKITDFQTRAIKAGDYTFNSEFEESYKNLFHSQFRAVTFKLGDDVDWNCSQIFHIVRIKNLDSFCEFNKYNKSKSEITIVVQYDDWYNFKEFEFKYVFLHPDIVEIDRQIKELEDLRERKIKQIK